MEQSATNTTSTISGDKFIRQLEKVTGKAKKPNQKIEIDNDLINIPPKAPEILSPKFQLEQEQNKEEEEDLKKEFNINHIYEEINDGKILAELEFSFGGPNISFFQKYARLGLDEEKTNFVDFLFSDFATQIFLESKLSIHIDTAYIYYDGINTKESIDDIFWPTAG